MRVLNKKLVVEFASTHPEARQALQSWVAELEDAEWETPMDLKRRFPSASILGGKMVVFNVKGKKYRVLARIDYESGLAIVERLGTHAEYDEWVL